MNHKMPALSYRLLLLFALLAVPALACATLLGDGSEDTSPDSTLEESPVESTEDEPAQPPESPGAGEEGTGIADPEADPAGTVFEAMRSRLTVDAVRMTITSDTSGVTTVTTLEFVRPDSYHVISEGTEFIAVGGNTYLKGANGEWIETPVDIGSFVGGILDAFADSQLVEDQLDQLTSRVNNVRFAGRETINGVETLVYEYNEVETVTNMSGQGKVWIGADDSLIYRQETESTVAGTTTRTLIEYEYGESVTIEAPIP